MRSEVLLKQMFKRSFVKTCLLCVAIGLGAWLIYRKVVVEEGWTSADIKRQKLKAATAKRAEIAAAAVKKEAAAKQAIIPPTLIKSSESELLGNGATGYTVGKDLTINKTSATVKLQPQAILPNPISAPKPQLPKPIYVEPEYPTLLNNGFGGYTREAQKFVYDQNTKLLAKYDQDVNDAQAAYATQSAAYSAANLS
jgi:hypothetical protein